MILCPGHQLLRLVLLLEEVGDAGRLAEALELHVTEDSGEVEEGAL